MNIAVLGTGYVGGTLGPRLGTLGHRVIFGSREPESKRAKELVAQNPDQLSVSTLWNAAEQSEVIIYAAPWPVAQATLESIGDLQGKVLVDCTNPLNERFDDIELGYSESAAERIAQWAPGAHVVKAFNTISSKTMGDPDFGGTAASVFYCGDEPKAKATVAKLIENLGFDPIDSGDLKAARYLEPMAMLCIQLAIHKRVEGECALKILRR